MEYATNIKRRKGKKNLRRMAEKKRVKFCAEEYGLKAAVLLHVLVHAGQQRRVGALFRQIFPNIPYRDDGVNRNAEFFLYFHHSGFDALFADFAAVYRNEHVRQLYVRRTF